MKLKLLSYIFPIFLFFFILSSCSRNEKNEKSEIQVAKINEDGIPVMHPLAEELPKLSTSFINSKKNEIQNYFDKTWSRTNDNVGFLVAKNGQIIFEKYLGYANKSTKENLTENTPLHIASVSKVLTSTAILMLVDAGKIKLEQKVNTIIKNFPYPEVTIQTLLNHRSGMKNYAYFTCENNIWDKQKILTNEDIVTLMAEKKIPLESTTDTKFCYCNTNYAVLALIIERITGLNYPEAMSEMIFKPLNMSNTFVYEEEKHKALINPSYKGNDIEVAMDYLDGIYGDKNIYSTPRDLLKFDKARYSPFFLNHDLIKKIYKGYSYEHPGQKNYGLGVRIVEFDKGEPYFFHNGWWHGNTSSLITLRKEKVTIIILSNKFTKKTYQAKRLSSLFGDYPFKLKDNCEE